MLLLLLSLSLSCTVSGADQEHHYAHSPRGQYPPTPPPAAKVIEFDTAACSVFMWGAKSGEEQLPPFPEPTHRGIRNKGQLSGDVKRLFVDFPSAAARQSALPVVRGQIHLFGSGPAVTLTVCVCVCTC